MDARIRAIQHLWYPPESHPYVKFEHRVRSYVRPDAVILDAGCGHGAPVLRKIAPLAAQAIGVDRVPRTDAGAGFEYLRADLHALPLGDNSVDLIFCRSVLEHLEEPLQVFHELARVLRESGHLVCLTPNKWDYASLTAMAIPNTWHPAIVNATEGRPKSEVFPTYYRANTKRRLRLLSRCSGLAIAHFEYLGQYPSYLVFNPLLFRLGCHYDRLLAAIRFLHWLRGWILVDLIKPNREGPCGLRFG